MGGQADAERDGQDGHHREPRRPDQHAHAVPEISDKGVHDEHYYGLSVPRDSVGRGWRKKRPLEPQLLPRALLSPSEGDGDEERPDRITPGRPVQRLRAHPPEPHEGPRGRHQRIYDGLDDEGQQLTDEEIPNTGGPLNGLGAVEDV